MNENDVLSNKDTRIIELMQTRFYDVVKQNDKYCHVACLCHGHKILGMNRNCLNSHAEINTIRSVCALKNIECNKKRLLFIDKIVLTRKEEEKKRRKRKCKLYTMYVIRCNLQGYLFNSKPCSNCLQQLKDCGMIKRIVFSNENGQVVTVSIDLLKSDHITRGQFVKF